MNAHLNISGTSRIAVLGGSETLIKNVQDALDLMATVRHLYACDKVILKKEHLSEDFFELKTKLAGEVLQKYANYFFKIAIVGDFGVYHSKSLNDFIYECNNGGSVFFLPDEASAAAALHRTGAGGGTA
jgi:hypothetical protein